MKNCKIQVPSGRNQLPHRRGCTLNSTKQILRLLITVGLICLEPSAIAVAETLPESTSDVINSDFRKIEQPLPLKLGVTFGGLTLIAAEVWWFLLKNNTEPAKISGEVQEIEMTVQGGDEPNQ